MGINPTLTLVDRPDRRVLFAVELIDPLTQATVYRGVDVRAPGLDAKPIISQSGRFVWLEQGTFWPDTVTVDTGRLPYVPHVAAAPPRPADLATAGSEARRVRILLRPTTGYTIEEGTTAIRGQLFETAAAGSLPISGARVQLAWRDESGNWSPLPPAPEQIGPGPLPSPREQETNAAGEFLVFLNLRPDQTTKPDVDEDGFLAVRLQVTQGRTAPMTRVTPDDFEFVPGVDDPNGTRRGRVREGRVLARDVKLAWSELTPV
jgi:hypothetical protein